MLDRPKKNIFFFFKKSNKFLLAYLLNTLTALNNRSHCFKVLTVVKRTLAMRRDVNVSDKMIVWYLCMLWIDRAIWNSHMILLHFNINWQWTQVSSVSRVMTGPEVSGCRWPLCQLAILPFCHHLFAILTSSCHLPYIHAIFPNLFHFDSFL